MTTIDEVPVIKNIGILLQKMEECGAEFCAIVWLRLHHDSWAILFCDYMEGLFLYRIDGRTMTAAIRRGRLKMIGGSYRLRPNDEGSYD